MGKIAFISGHRDLTTAEFEKHYLAKIENALKEGHSFVVGDAVGGDLFSQQYLFGKTPNVVVYFAGKTARNNVGFKSVGGFKSYTERDEAMTMNSDYDIAWVRGGKKKSGTKKNLNRRVEQKTVRILFPID